MGRVRFSCICYIFVLDSALWTVTVDTAVQFFFSKWYPFVLYSRSDCLPTYFTRIFISHGEKYCSAICVSFVIGKVVMQNVNR